MNIIEEECKEKIKIVYGFIMIGISEWFRLVKFLEEVEKIIQKRVEEIIFYLKNWDFENLVEVVYFEIGVCFFFYSEISQDQVMFLFEIIENILMDIIVYIWGIYDGIIRLIEISFKDYFERFVFDRDFSVVDMVIYNSIIGGGVIWDNIIEFYYWDIMVQYYFYEFEEGVMDWSSFCLVFSEYNG